MNGAFARSFGGTVTLCIAAPALAQTAEEAANEAYYLYAARDYAAAAKAARVAVERDPGNSAYRLLLADALAQSGAQAAVPDVLDASDTSYPIQSRLAESYFATSKWRRAAEAFRHSAADAPDAVRRSYAKRAQALSLVYAGERERAAAVVRETVTDPQLETGNSLDWAMVAIAAGEDRIAQQILANEELYPQLTRQTALDAAYSAKRAMLDERAIRFFERGLALDEDSPEQLSGIERNALRREIALLSRQWTLNGQIAYGETERLPAFLNLPASPERDLQAGAELGYRIGGWRNGRPVTVFARAFGAIDAGEGSDVDDALQGWVGVQHKPFANLNLVLEASRLIAIDGPALDDWAVRTAFSATRGLEPDPERFDWPFRDVYADLSYLLDADAALGVARVRYGHSFVVSGSANPLVVTPFAVSQLSYDSVRPQEFALGAGAGISLRQWLGGTSLRAALSHVELAAQLHTRIAGDRRAEGVHVSLGFGF